MQDLQFTLRYGVRWEPPEWANFTTHLLIIHFSCWLVMSIYLYSKFINRFLNYILFHCSVNFLGQCHSVLATMVCGYVLIDEKQIFPFYSPLPLKIVLAILVHLFLHLHFSIILSSGGGIFSLDWYCTEFIN